MFLNIIAIFTQSYNQILFFMNKKVLFICLLTFIGLQSCQSDTIYVLKAGSVSMTIDAENGARIISFKCGDREVLSQLHRGESFGSTFWTSPQKDWNWPPVPEFDKLPYTVEQKDGKLVMKSEISEQLKYRIIKSFSADEETQSILVTYTVVNESGEDRSVAPWEISRVPNAGQIFFDTPVNEISPAGLLDFHEVEGLSWYQADVANENRKINADGKGWLAYANDGLLLVKQFQDLDSSEPAPGEAEVQVYVNNGKTYIELESQGTYTHLHPGEQLEWTVRWMLVPYEGESESPENLISQVRKLLK